MGALPLAFPRSVTISRLWALPVWQAPKPPLPCLWLLIDQLDWTLRHEALWMHNKSPLHSPGDRLCVPSRAAARAGERHFPDTVTISS
jgi:hypothetical protein